MSNTPEYIVDLFNQGRTVDVTNYLSRGGHITYLLSIKARFDKLSEPSNPESPQLYIIAQENFEAVKIGLAKCPYKRMQGLQTGNPNKLTLLYYYDPAEHIKEYSELECFEKEEDIFEHERNQRNFIAGSTKLEGEWFAPCARSFRMMIRMGVHILMKFEEVEHADT